MTLGLPNLFCLLVYPWGTHWLLELSAWCRLSRCCTMPISFIQGLLGPMAVLAPMPPDHMAPHFPPLPPPPRSQRHWPAPPRVTRATRSTGDFPSPRAIRAAAGSQACSPGRRQRTASAALLPQLPIGSDAREGSARARSVSARTGSRSWRGSVSRHGAVAPCNCWGGSGGGRQTGLAKLSPLWWDLLWGSSIDICDFGILCGVSHCVHISKEIVHHHEILSWGEAARIKKTFWNFVRSFFRSFVRSFVQKEMKGLDFSHIYLWWNVKKITWTEVAGVKNEAQFCTYVGTDNLIIFLSLISLTQTL